MMQAVAAEAEAEAVVEKLGGWRDGKGARRRGPTG
jgi:hypothetical protein